MYDFPNMYFRYAFMYSPDAITRLRNLTKPGMKPGLKYVYAYSEEEARKTFEKNYSTEAGELLERVNW